MPTFSSFSQRVFYLSSSNTRHTLSQSRVTQERQAERDAAAAAVAGITPLPDHILLSLANVQSQQDGGSNAPKSRTVFGPAVSQPPVNATSASGAPLLDSHNGGVPVSVMQDWASKRQQSLEATTTLQALVNLKTSSIRLSPLSVDHQKETEDENPDETPTYEAPHGLEFQFDCDAAKAKVTLSFTPPQSAAPGTSTPVIPSVFFESVLDGGFGRSLHLEDGASLEMASWLSSNGASSTITTEGTDPAGTPNVSSAPREPTGSTQQRPKKRMSAFPFKRRHHRDDVSGPALRVVDVDAVTEPSEVVPGIEGEKKQEEKSVEVSIMIEALNDEGRPLAVRNVQVTTLRIISTGSAAAGPEESDTRHWTVQIARRDAIIGTHTFRLQDIYGLSSQSTSTTSTSTTSTSPPEESANTYPPQPPPLTANDSSDMRSECVLCLSSPREVVLLPCRHLVACKDCALNMVEFGAGGALTQPTEPIAVQGEAGAGSAVDTTEPGAPLAGAGTADAPATPTTQGGPLGFGMPTTRTGRRKRKAKGWHCPICRQPYTSMLRITTTAPKGELPAVVEPIVAANLSTASPAARPGLTTMLTRPSFLRSRSNAPPQSSVQTPGVNHPLQAGA